MTDLPLALRNYFNFSSQQLQVAHSDHVRILDAVKGGESERAAGLLREHIWAARDCMLPPPNDDLSKHRSARCILQSTSFDRTRDLFHPTRTRKGEGRKQTECSM